MAAGDSSLFSVEQRRECVGARSRPFWCSCWSDVAGHHKGRTGPLTKSIFLRHLRGRKEKAGDPGRENITRTKQKNDEIKQHRGKRVVGRFPGMGSFRSEQVEGAAEGDWDKHCL